MIDEITQKLAADTKSFAQEMNQAKSGFLPQLIEALKRADFQVPHSQQHDDAMDNVWELVSEYELSQ